MKVCTKCSAEKDEMEFYKRSDGRGVEGACKECRKKQVNKIEHNRRQRGYYSQPNIRAKRVAYKAKQRRKAGKPTWAERYPNKGDPKSKPKDLYGRLASMNAYQAWRYWLTAKAPDWWMEIYLKESGKQPWQDPRLSDADKYRMRYNSDMEFNLKERIRRQFKKHLRGHGTSSLMRELGYTTKDLKAHLNKQFTKGMSWDNYGDWHIDHIIPVSSFQLNDINEIKTCWALPNLRPMWGTDNIRKNNRMEFLC